MAHYVMTFEKGGAFELRFDPAAPKTAEAFRTYLDGCGTHQALALQGRFSGEELYFPAPLGNVGAENGARPRQGCVAFNPNPEWSAICIYWGDDIAEGKRYHNLFAHLEGDMDLLYEVGTRIWQKGGETVTVKKVDDISSM